jgi:hypothetical protein
VKLSSALRPCGSGRPEIPTPEINPNLDRGERAIKRAEYGKRRRRRNLAKKACTIEQGSAAKAFLSPLIQIINDAPLLLGQVFLERQGRHR